MSRARTASVVETRPTRPEDGEFFAPCTWLTIDSRGYRFGGTSADESLALAQHYHGLRRRDTAAVQASAPELPL